VAARRGGRPSVVNGFMRGSLARSVHACFHRRSPTEGWLATEWRLTQPAAISVYTTNSSSSLGAVVQPTQPLCCSDRWQIIYQLAITTGVFRVNIDGHFRLTPLYVAVPVGNEAHVRPRQRFFDHHNSRGKPARTNYRQASIEPLRVRNICFSCNRVESDELKFSYHQKP